MKETRLSSLASQHITTAEKVTNRHLYSPESNPFPQNAFQGQITGECIGGGVAEDVVPCRMRTLRVMYSNRGECAMAESNESFAHVRRDLTLGSDILLVRASKGFGRFPPSQFLIPRYS